ncbi:FtsX-like permease family protein [Candidatus Izimaplasma bacterium HR1]|jgi:putative ABC transport system permease protein|uniref:ABC transporter permease n=1 Tax=Candidatus Izimoplasma sp. HR1 TaxID=1541959 RepID=UPI0004F5AEC9|nr:FtsX-like permease family protein [Candidatus Izimaplasma bacterium HR1]
MKLLYKDQLRKIKANLFNFISLCLLVIIITLTFTAVKSSVRRLDANYDDYLQTQQIEDFYFNMGEVDVNYVGGNTVMELCTELDIFNECLIKLSLSGNDPSYLNELNFLINEKIQDYPLVYENLIDNYVNDFVDRYDYKVEKGHIVNILENDFVYKFISITEEINIPYVVEGRLPEENFEISIFPEFAEINNIELGDVYTINNKEYNIVGFHYQPEFLFPIFSMNTISFDPAYQTLVLTNKATIDDLDQFIFTKYFVQGDLDIVLGDVGYSTLQSGDLSLLGKNMQLVNIIMPADINFRIISLEKEVDTANAFINIFLPLFITFITILLIVFMKRYIDKNKKDIKILHALGYTDNEITRSILIYPLLISLTSIIGYILGLLVSNELFNIYSSRYLFPKADFIIDVDLLLLTTLLPIIAITILNYLFILLSLKRREKTIHKFKLRIFKFTTIRTVLTTTLLFITISTMITFGLNGNSMFTSFIETTKLGNNFYEMVNLQYMTNTDHFDNYEEYTKVPGKIIEVNSTRLKIIKNTNIYGINPENDLKLLINNSLANNYLLEDGIIVSDYLQTSLALKIGDTITYEVGGVETTEIIQGFSNELIENNFYTMKENLNRNFNLDNTYYNGLFVSDDQYDDPFITSRIDYQNSLDEFKNILNISTVILDFLIALSIVLSLFIFALILVSYFIDNRFNIAILKSVGYNNKEINKKYLSIIYILLVASYIVSIPITNTLLEHMLKMLMDSVGFKLILDISIINIVLGFIVLNIIFVSIIYFVNKYYDKINISEVMKHITK